MKMKGIFILLNVVLGVAFLVIFFTPFLLLGFAVPLFGEVPTPVQIAGYVLILTAVVLVATGLR